MRGALGERTENMPSFPSLSPPFVSRPYSRTPLGARMPSFLKRSPCDSGRTTASMSSVICLSQLQQRTS